MKPEHIERICRGVVSIASLICTTIVALKFQNATILWWYIPVFIFNS